MKLEVNLVEFHDQSTIYFFFEKFMIELALIKFGKIFHCGVLFSALAGEHDLVQPEDLQAHVAAADGNDVFVPGADDFTSDQNYYPAVVPD